LSLIEFRNTAKYLLATIICLLLASPIVAGCLVQAYTPPGGWPPGQPYFTLHATVTTDPYWGYYGGYHAVWAAIQSACAQIGINIEINQYSEFDWYDRVWETGWNKSWDEGGWDMFINEWWLQPHAPDPWFSSMVYSWADPWPLPEGYNIAPWRNSDADGLLWKGMHYFDANQRKTYLWLWQEEFMRDPPWANIYYPRIFEVMGRYVLGYDPSGCWFYDVAHLELDNAMLAEARPDRDPRTIIYAVSEPLWSMNPMFTDTYTDEQFITLQFRTLYKWSADPWPESGKVPDSDEYVIKPDLAADYPKYLKATPTSANGTRVRVPLRQGARWSDGVKINATDVKWTFDTMFTTKAKASGIGDFSYVIKSVEIVDEYRVDFILYDPFPDILSILSNDWGTGAILPWHFLKDISVGSLKSHGSNWGFTTPDLWMPVSGPFKARYGTNTVQPGTRAILDRNPLYYGYNTSIVGSPAWGPYNIDTLIMQWIEDPASRLVALEENDVDFGEYPTAPVATFKLLNNTANYPYLRVMQYDYPASNPVWFNFDNEYISNRYVRLAICHAIPYSYIINQILPPWGIETSRRGKTYILPHHYYTYGGTTVHLFNEDLQPFQENITLAQKYMDLWRYSKVGTDYTKGPVGDADFNRLVELPDWYIWRDWFGSTSSEWDYLPGQDIDPDFTNNDYVDMYDFYAWRPKFGTTYP